MPNFVIRCRKAPVRADRFLAAVGSGGHVEFIAGMITNALFISKGHRANVTLHLGFEDSADFSRILTFDGAHMGDLGGLSEQALLASCALALKGAERLGKEQCVTAPNGIVVETLSFEGLIKRQCLAAPCYLMSPKGQSLTQTRPDDAATFILTDQVPLSKNALSGLKRQGVGLLSLGRNMLFASQCLTLIHGHFDSALD